MTLVIFAEITARKGLEETVRDNLKSLVEPTRAEPGCIRYDLYQDSLHPERFMFHEVWDSAAALDRHKKSVHITAFAESTGAAIASVKTRPMAGIAAKE